MKRAEYPGRKSGLKASDLDPERLIALNRGEVATATYVEMTAVDFRILLGQIAPEIEGQAACKVLFADGRSVGLATRMARVGDLLANTGGERSYWALSNHPSDTVRGWVAHMVPALWPGDLCKQLIKIESLADDPHFGVREWAWLALRPEIAKNISFSLRALLSWSHSASANLRRFAVESTRPRGFWSKHIDELKKHPALGLPLLSALRADPSRYVQLAVANWLNDASKSQPCWVQKLCAHWSGDEGKATAFIIKRALRTLKKKGESLRS